MLHKRELPAAEFEDLNKVYKIKRKFLVWLLRSPPAGQLCKKDLTRVFGQVLGSWFWLRIRNPAKRTKFGRALHSLAAKARSDNIEAKKVANAIRHDALFHKNWHQAGFELKFPNMFPNWLELIKDVAEPFYDWLASEKGFGKDTFRVG